MGVEAATSNFAALFLFTRWERLTSVDVRDA
jgi:hypothetical protein